MEGGSNELPKMKKFSAMERLKGCFYQSSCVGVIILVCLLFSLVRVHFPKLCLVAVGLVALGIVVKGVIAVIKRRRALNREGFYTREPFGCVGFVKYEENRDGKIDLLKIPVESIGTGWFVVVIPTRDQWNETMPEWAEDRRDEICKRVIAVMPRERVRLANDWFLPP
ncbi:MAG: hypothetical protein ACI8V5_000577 [Limisphaerales bacterium]|jgi:hypothetical protein